MTHAYTATQTFTRVHAMHQEQFIATHLSIHLDIHTHCHIFRRRMSLTQTKASDHLLRQHARIKVARNSKLGRLNVETPLMIKHLNSGALLMIRRFGGETLLMIGHLDGEISSVIKYLNDRALWMTARLSGGTSLMIKHLNDGALWMIGHLSGGTSLMIKHLNDGASWMTGHFNSEISSMTEHFQIVKELNDLPMTEMNLPGLHVTGETADPPIDDGLAMHHQARLVMLTKPILLHTLEVYIKVYTHVEVDSDPHASGAEPQNPEKEADRLPIADVHEAHPAAFITTPVIPILYAER